METNTTTDSITPVPKIRGQKKCGLNFKSKTLSLPKQYHRFIETEAKRLGIKKTAYVRGLLNKYKDWFTMIEPYKTSILNLNILPSSIDLGNVKFRCLSNLLQTILSLEIIPRNDHPIPPLPLDIPKEILIQYFQTFFHTATGTNINSPISFECNGLKYVLRGNVFACVGGEPHDYIPKTRKGKK
jgi:hypothetical protein